MQIIHCPTNVTEIYFSDYMKREFADIFEILPYNPVFQFYAFVSNILYLFFTRVYNFFNFFIVLKLDL